jgi:hypothetical protein
MFPALLGLTEHHMPGCTACPGEMQLHLSFAFALGITVKDAVAVAGFLLKPLPEWGDGGRKVTFYPFLVIVERPGKGRAAWLPYFHVAQDAKRSVCKYGQWAPFIGLDLFEDVLQQARQAGYLVSV